MSMAASEKASRRMRGIQRRIVLRRARHEMALGAGASADMMRYRML